MILHLTHRDPAAVATRATLSGILAETYARMGDTAAAYDAAHPVSAAWAAYPETVQDPDTCRHCRRTHPAVFTIRRVPADTLGPWIVYRVNGEGRTLPGGGVPLTVDRLPRDAVRMDQDAAHDWWHSD